MDLKIKTDFCFFNCKIYIILFISYNTSCQQMSVRGDAKSVCRPVCLACLIAWCIIHAPVMDDMRDDVSAWYILCPSSHSFAWQERGLESIKFPPPRYRLLPNPPSLSVLSVFKSIAGALDSINEGDCLVSTYDRGREEALSDDIRGPMLKHILIPHCLVANCLKMEPRFRHQGKHEMPSSITVEAWVLV